MDKNSKIKKKNVVLIGVGPHAKRIYLKYFSNHKINLVFVVELKSNHDKTRKFLNENGFGNTKIYIVDDFNKDKEHLTEKDFKNLTYLCKFYEISHIIISTEPKAHNAYIEFSLINDIEVITDKPITVNKNMLNLKSIRNLKKQYYNLCELQRKSKANCYVMCQRKYHRGYEYIKQLLTETVYKYNVPITYIDIYHCDGNWEMLHDLYKENHPYKYGYGKLFHSGYHFIDLLSDLISINEMLVGDKKITKGYVYTQSFTPNDEINIFNINDYNNIFEKQVMPKIYQYLKNKKIKFKNFGEKNYYGMFTFKNKNNQTITTANLNLLHYGFSRRGWIESRDYYKKNGRVRHERVNIQVGTLLNIQIHSYQSKEIKDRISSEIEESVGGLEHFDIDIYRNVDIIGGKPFERIKLGSLYTEKEKKNFIGYNELSREIFLNNFFQNKCDKGSLNKQILPIEILYSCAMGLYNVNKNKNKPEKIKVLNHLRLREELNMLQLRKSSQNYYNNFEKVTLNHFEIFKNKYSFGITINYIKEKEKYEVFLFVQDVQIVGGLLTKVFSSKIFAYLYYYYIFYKLNSNEKNIIKWIKKSIEKK